MEFEFFSSFVKLTGKASYALVKSTAAYFGTEPTTVVGCVVVGGGALFAAYLIGPCVVSTIMGGGELFSGLLDAGNKPSDIYWSTTEVYDYDTAQPLQQDCSNEGLMDWFWGDHPLFNNPKRVWPPNIQ